MIKLACEIPFNYLEDFSKHTDFDFSLVHLVESNQGYKDFFKKQRENGRYVILDNSAFELERAVSIERMIRGIEAIHPSAVIAPDVLEDSTKTLESMEAFCIEIGKRGLLGQVEIGAVVQGKDLDSFEQCLQGILTMPEISLICFPFDINFWVPGAIDTGSKTSNWMLRRVHLLRYFEENGIIPFDYYRESGHKKFHLLGCSNPLEYYYLEDLKGISSCDTSCAIVHGSAGIKLNGRYGLVGEKIKQKLDFDAVFNQEQIETTLYNIEVIKKFCRGEREEK